MAGEHGLGLAVAGEFARGAVGPIKLVLADDELQTFIAREQLAELDAAVALRVSFVFPLRLPLGSVRVL